MNRNLTVTIKKDSILYFITAIPFFPIDYVEFILPVWETIFSYARILVILVYLYRLIAIRRNITTPLVLAIVYLICCFLSTWLAGTNFSVLITNGVYLFGLILLIEDGAYFNADAMIEGLLFLFEILVYANLLYFILNPNGYDAGASTHYYFFGNYNTTIRKLFIGIVLGGVQAFRTKNRITIRFTCMYLALLIFLVLVGAATALVGMLIFAVAIIYFSFRGKSGIFKFEYFLIASAVISVLFAILGQFSFAENIITGIFGKNMELSGRTGIWENTIIKISQSPILGYGQLSNNSTSQLIRGVDPHNMLLGVLFYGGVVGFAVLIIMLIFLGRKMRKNRASCSPIAAVFDAGFCAYFIMWCFEPFSNIKEFFRLYAFFVLAYYCAEFIKSSKFNTPKTIRLQIKEKNLAPDENVIK